jgi:hypothetical protein
MQSVGASHSKHFLLHSFVMMVLQNLYALAISDECCTFSCGSVSRDTKDWTAEVLI